MTLLYLLRGPPIELVNVENPGRESHAHRLACSAVLLEVTYNFAMYGILLHPRQVDELSREVPLQKRESIFGHGACMLSMVFVQLQKSPLLCRA